jgi:hypothetical protein
MLWNQDLNGFVCPHGCFALYEITPEKVPSDQADAAIDYLESINHAIKEMSHGYK